jgi:hypothetical protein
MERHLWDILLDVVGSCGLIATGAIVGIARPTLWTTTLRIAWCWFGASVVLWTIAWVGDVVFSGFKASIADQLWYFTGITQLCALVAVLGARRPTVRVWTGFVLVPLAFVLGLPALSAWSDGVPNVPLRLETPAIIGFSLVLVMGAGNYFGTRFTFSILCLCGALVLLLLPSALQSPDLTFEPGLLRRVATIVLSCAVLQAAQSARRIPTPSGETSCHRLWIDFRDWFGIVWAKRIQDRVNVVASQEKWPVRLDLYGWNPTSANSDGNIDEAISSRIEQTFRWLLRRFVEPGWIDERIDSRNDSPPPDAD